MPRIQILPDILSNKIAAGEVVERPASVVKELLENAIDANSSRILIDIENGGRSLIRISDNGSGMSRDDALLSIERYATSKIHTDADLFSIKTLGFRGEALPSIAAVSRFSLATRDSSSETGTRIQIDGGKIKNVMEAGTPVGTMIDVKNLFYNVPARRKFLKSSLTEMGHILETVSAVALGCPEIGFRITHNGKPVKNWPPTDNPLDRVSSMFGQDIRGDLHQLQMESQDVSVSGWISSPSLTRSTSQKIYLYVNGRFIRDRGLQHALFEGYRGRLMKGRFPVAVLYIHVPHEQLDVNVHPTKHEVRFTGYRNVYETLKSAVFRTWDNLEHKKFKPTSQNQGIPSTLFQNHETARTPAFSKNPHQNREIPFPVASRKPLVESGPLTDKKEIIAEEPYPYRSSRHSDKQIGKTPPHDDPEMNKTHSPSVETQIPLAVIGQLHNTYIVCESENELVLLDQHAAHERILFEHLKRKSKITGSPVQKLLIPEIIDLGYRESITLEKLIPGLTQYGLEIEPFGGTAFAVKAVPSLISDKEIKPLILEMVESIGDIGFSEGIEKTLDACLILMACHGSIRGNQSLSITEMTGLIHQLASCENPSTCPHGRPIRISWPIPELEKKFKRIL